MTDAERAAVFDALDPGAGVLGEVLAGSKPRRVHDLEGNALTLGLPSSHPPIRTFLIVPVMSGPQPDGWLYFADKLGADAFSDSDEQFAVMLAAQLAPAYENLVLYDEIRQHAGQLRQEIEARQRALTELTESELRFRQLAENIREVFFLTDPINGRALYVSPAYEDIWGCSCESLYTRPQSWLEAVHPDDRQQVSEVTESINTTGRFQMTYRIIRPDGAICWIRTRGCPIRDATGKLYRIAGLSEDITEHQEQQEKIARLSRIYAVLSGINSAIVRIRDRSEIFREACRIAVTEGLFKMAWIGTIDPDTLDGEVVTWFGDEKRYIFSDFRLTARADTPYSDWPACRAVREMKPVITNHVGAEPSLAPIKTDLLERGILSIAALPLIVGKRTAAALVLYAAEADFFTAEELKLLNELAGDIAFSLEFIEKEEKLSYLAYYDVLTGLANSTLFHDRLTQLLNGPRRAMHIIAVLLIDLDRFTQLNDTLGRHAGDALLKAVAERLKDTLPDPNGLARISADTFAVALTGLQQGTDAALILQDRIFEPLKQVFTVDGDEVRLSARAGIALCPGDGEDASTLFKNAEAALKQAQSSGERLLYYAPEINAKVAQKLTLESKLRTALEHEQFVLHYQPKLDARDGRLSGFEALIRWQDPDAGLVPPGQFIPLLEETGLILEVGWWALEKALSDYRRWHDAGMQVPPIAETVSAVQLQQRNVASLVRRAIDSSSAGPKALELEITESLIMADIETNIETLRQISDMGVTIAIDDFGTGYSSLRYLAKLPVHSLKIDRSFIITMINDPNSMTIVSTVISLAHALALKVVAEGVDSEEQSKLLRLLKCDEMQGYRFSQPVPADKCVALIQNGGKFEVP
jgi:diguanylate cyclase (GGDEF)-like protein/PAS domain S-box-containing protein